MEQQKQQLLQQATSRNRANQVQNSTIQVEQLRNKLNREVQQFQRANGEDAELDYEGFDQAYPHQRGENLARYDQSLPLSRELQQHPWPQNYKPCISPFDGQSNPR